MRSQDLLGTVRGARRTSYMACIPRRLCRRLDPVPAIPRPFPFMPMKIPGRDVPTIISLPSPRQRDLGKNGRDYEYEYATLVHMPSSLDNWTTTSGHHQALILSSPSPQHFGQYNTSTTMPSISSPSQRSSPPSQPTPSGPAGRQANKQTDNAGQPTNGCNPGCNNAISLAQQHTHAHSIPTR